MINPSMRRAALQRMQEAGDLHRAASTVRLISGEAQRPDQTEEQFNRRKTMLLVAASIIDKEADISAGLAHHSWSLLKEESLREGR